MKNKWTVILLSWVVTVSGIFIASTIIYRSGGRGYPVYWSLLSAAAVASALTGAKFGRAGFLVALPSFVLMGFVSYISVPLSGYGGTDITVAFRYSIIFSLAAGAGAWLLWAWKADKVCQIVLTIQVVMLATALGSLNPLYLQKTQQWGEILTVRQLNFANGVSMPFIEEDTAYVLDGDRKLYRVDLATGKKDLIVAIPKPSPMEAGHPGLSIAPDQPGYVQGRIIRNGEKELTVFYPYYLYRVTDSGQTISVEYLIEACVKLDTKTVTWQLFRQCMDGWFYPYEVTQSDYSISIGGVRSETLVVLGNGVETHVWAKGRIHWLDTAPGRFLAGTDSGEMYIIDLPVQKEKQETGKPLPEPKELFTDEWHFNDDYTEVTLNGATYKNIVFILRVGRELYFCNAAAYYLQNPDFRTRFTPEEFFNHAIRDEAFYRMQGAYPECELLTVNNEPWQQSEFRDIYLEHTLNNLKNTYLPNPPSRDEALDFLLNPSNNGYAYLVFYDKLTTQAAIRTAPLSSLEFSTRASDLYKTFEEFIYDAGDFSIALGRDIRQPFAEFQRILSLPYPVLGEAPVWRLEGVIMPGEANLAVYINDDNGTNITFDAAPYREKDIVWIPAEWFSVFRTRVEWWEQSRQLILLSEDNHTLRSIGTQAVMVDNRLYFLPEPIRVTGGIVYVPLQLFARHLSLDVKEGLDEEIRVKWSK